MGILYRSAEGLTPVDETSPLRSLTGGAVRCLERKIAEQTHTPASENRNTDLPDKVSATRFAGWGARNRWLLVFPPPGASYRESL
jgi:hypothetical protein